MKRVMGCVLLGAVVLLTDAGATARSEPEGTLEATRLVRRALERAAWARDQGFEGRYRCEMTRDVRRFDSDGRIEREEVREFEIEPVDGVPFARVVARDGQPLSAEEIAAEQERRQQFAEAVANGTHVADEEDDEIVFNEDVVGRYTFQTEGEEQLRGRLTYRLAFRPRAGRLPVRRHLDHALNNAQGALWIDQATFEVARIEFTLIDRVRMWWGILGSISHARGSFDRYPIEEEIWAPLQLETYIDARVLFRSNRRAELSQWRNFEGVSAAGGERARQSNFAIGR